MKWFKNARLKLKKEEFTAMRKGWIGLAIMAIVIPALFGFTVPAEAITGKQYDTGYMGGILRLGNNGFTSRGIWETRRAD